MSSFHGVGYTTNIFRVASSPGSPPREYTLIFDLCTRRKILRGFKGQQIITHARRRESLGTRLYFVYVYIHVHTHVYTTHYYPTSYSTNTPFLPCKYRCQPCKLLLQSYWLSVIAQGCCIPSKLTYTSEGPASPRYIENNPSNYPLVSTANVFVIRCVVQYGDTHVFLPAAGTCGCVEQQKSAGLQFLTGQTANLKDLAPPLPLLSSIIICRSAHNRRAIRLRRIHGNTGIDVAPNYCQLSCFHSNHERPCDLPRPRNLFLSRGQGTGKIREREMDIFAEVGGRHCKEICRPCITGHVVLYTTTLSSLSVTVG